MSTTARLPSAFLFETLEAPLDPLERLPRSLWLGGSTHSLGQLETRLSGLEAWRDALLAGRLPDGMSCWPAQAWQEALRRIFERLELPRWCASRPDLAEAVLLGLLFHLDLIPAYRDRGATEDEAVRRALDAFEEDWSERCGNIREWVEMFGDPGDLLKNMNWDRLTGLLRSSGWSEVVRIRGLIEGLPELVRILRRLGRERASERLETVPQASAPVMAPAVAFDARSRSVRIPDLPGETRGVRRSGQVARMLPAEAMLLGHPALRLVWHARRTERTLLTYEDDERMSEVRHERVRTLRPTASGRPERRMEMGPMLICVDTSGSMQGGAETVAKAVVLEAACTAHAQRRACHVFAFSGPDEVVEMSLSLDLDGVSRLTQFLGQSFCGGTDIGGPLERVLERLEDNDWQRADLLLATDGEFGATRVLADRLQDVCNRSGVRVQGVLIGDRETIGLRELADEIFWVRDWRRFGGSENPSPVHSSHLTATYFPGALRTTANRAATISGTEASQAVRTGRRSPSSSKPCKGDA